MPVLTYLQCDMCGRKWREGANPKAMGVKMSVREAKHKYERKENEVAKEGIFCDGHCAELAFAAIVRNIRPQELRPQLDRWERDTKRRELEAESRMFNMTPNIPPDLEATDEDEDGDYEPL